MPLDDRNLATDQKAGGSNPSERATLCAVSTLTGGRKGFWESTECVGVTERGAAVGQEPDAVEDGGGLVPVSGQHHGGRAVPGLASRRL